jgi:hypothetical protein
VQVEPGAIQIGRGISLGAAFHQKSEYRESRLRGKGAEGADNFGRFHIFKYIELLTIGKLGVPVARRPPGERAKLGG